MVTVLIADDHGVLRDGLRCLFAGMPDIEVVGEACTGRETLYFAQQLKPDVVLLDIAMPDLDGLVVTRALKESDAEVRVLILTASQEKAILKAAIEAGASGYVVKRAIESELIGAIEAVMRGDMYVHPAVTRALLEDTILESPASKTGEREILSPREKEVLVLLCEGLTNAEIAERLILSPRTVESHRANLMGKLQLGDRAELFRYAQTEGLIPKPALETLPK